MEGRSRWYERIDTEINQYQVSMGKKEAGKYKLDLLRRVAGRVDDFSNICGECQTYKSEIDRLVQEMSLIIQMPGKRDLKSHVKAVNGLVEHLKKVHKLVDKGYYLGLGVGIGMAAGAAIGAGLGAVFDNPGAGTGVGIALGVAIGMYLDKKAEREGKVI